MIVLRKCSLMSDHWSLFIIMIHWLLKIFEIQFIIVAMFNTDKQSAAINYSWLSHRCKPKFIMFSNLGIVSVWSIKVQQYSSWDFSFLVQPKEQGSMDRSIGLAINPDVFLLIWFRLTQQLQQNCSKLELCCLKIDMNGLKTSFNGFEFWNS